MAYIRPTAAEYFRQMVDGEDDFYACKGNFLDDFYSGDNVERTRMVETPIPINLVTSESRKYASYFAGMVEYLCWHHHLTCPPWVQNDMYLLPEPWFLFDNWRFRAWQLTMTPPSFKSRNIFGGDEMLSRV